MFKPRLIITDLSTPERHTIEVPIIRRDMIFRYYISHAELEDLPLPDSCVHVLAFFLYASETSRGNYLQEERNNIMNGTENRVFGWSDQSVREVTESFGDRSRANIGRYIKLLTEKGFIESKPSVLHKQGKQYRANIKKILQGLEYKPESLRSYCEKKKISGYNSKLTSL